MTANSLEEFVSLFLKFSSINIMVNVGKQDQLHSAL